MIPSKYNGYSQDGRRLYRKGGGGGDGGAGEARAMEAERQAKIAAATGAVNDNFGQFNDNYFNSIADAFMAYQQPLFDEQVTKARRALPLNVSSTANSDYQRLMGEFETDAQRQQADLRGKATDFANERRAEVERNRADLVSLANAGTDASATASMAASRANALSKPPTFSPIADLFQKYTAGAALASQLPGAAAATQPDGTRPLLFSGGGKNTSVRTVR